MSYSTAKTYVWARRSTCNMAVLVVFASGTSLLKYGAVTCDLCLKLQVSLAQVSSKKIPNPFFSV